MGDLAGPVSRLGPHGALIGAIRSKQANLEQVMKDLLARFSDPVAWTCMPRGRPASCLALPIFTA
jgi:hypothetical protein